MSLVQNRFLLRSSILTCAIALQGVLVHAQAIAVSEMEEAGGVTGAATTNDSGVAGVVPEVRGFNASVAFGGQHDSSNGWSSVMTPNVAYRLNRYFSADMGVPDYLYINVDANVGTKAKPVYAYSTKHGVFGDAALSFHGETHADTLDYNGTVTVGLPSGNTAYGLGAGQVTYNLNNHFEKSLRIFTPDIELGFGDSSALMDARVKKSYIAVGEMAHFQAGTSVDLPFDMSFEADAYEELPLTTDLVYSTTGKGKKKVTTSTNQGPAEDNGFLTTLDVPVARHMTVSGFYNRSLRQHEDTAGFSFTLLLRAPPKQETK